jgi:hypothetical protein
MAETALRLLFPALPSLTLVEAEAPPTAVKLPAVLAVAVLAGFFHPHNPLI